MHDPDLSPVLEAASQEELDLLVRFLASHRTSLLMRDPDVRAYYPDHTRYIPKIVQEIQLFGGHTLKDRALGEHPGLPYARIVADAQRKLELGLDGASLEAQEDAVVAFVIDPAFDELPAERQTSLREAFARGDFFREGLARPGLFHQLLEREDPEHMRLNTSRAARTARKAAVRWVKAQLKGRALRWVMRLVLRGAAGPVGAALVLWDLLGPAYRVTIPVVCYVSYLRGRVGGEEE